MSNNAKKHIQELDRALCSGDPQPLNLGPLKRPKTGNGKATFKTATAAANASREARDEAKKILERCEYFGNIVRDCVNKDIESTRRMLDALEQNERKCRFYCIMLWVGAVVTTAAYITATSLFS